MKFNFKKMLTPTEKDRNFNLKTNFISWKKSVMRWEENMEKINKSQMLTSMIVNTKKRGVTIQIWINCML